MEYSERNTAKRIDFVDCLRGFAIIWIILLHFAEQFNMSALAEHTSADEQVLFIIRYFNTNKIFTIFALLFGFSTYIQYHNNEKRGYDFRPRLAWRMVLLFGFSILNMAVYSGDFLCTFALLGLFLIPFLKAKDNVILIFALIFFLQPIDLFNIGRSLLGYDVEPLSTYFTSNLMAMQDGWTDGTFMDVCRTNLANGYLVKIGRVVDNGRLTRAVFMVLIGLLMCRKRLFIDEGNNMRFWAKVMAGTIVFFTLVFLVKRYIVMPMPATPIRKSLLTILVTWRELCFTFIYVSTITLLYYRTRLHNIINHIRHLGKMTLTCYLAQSIAGSFLFYNWGLGLYRTASYAYSFLLGIIFLLLLHTFCRYWSKRHRRGPMEELWHKAMWIDQIIKR